MVPWGASLFTHKTPIPLLRFLQRVQPLSLLPLPQCTKWCCQSPPPSTVVQLPCLCFVISCQRNMKLHLSLLYPLGSLTNDQHYSAYLCPSSQLTVRQSLLFVYGTTRADRSSLHTAYVVAHRCLIDDTMVWSGAPAHTRSSRSQATGQRPEHISVSLAHTMQPALQLVTLYGAPPHHESGEKAGPCGLICANRARSAHCDMLGCGNIRTCWPADLLVQLGRVFATQGPQRVNVITAEVVRHLDQILLNTPPF